MDNVLRQLHRLAARGAGPQTDEDLIDRFFLDCDQDAFAQLVRRHGPMVFGVCMRVLHNRHDAEDAFQATFLTLVRKGQAIRQRQALASWLYRVAFRVALRLKAGADKRAADQLPEVAVEMDPAAAAAWRELRPVLDCELHRLPAKYRTPMILCYLEGKTYEEAAGEIGCPKGTVAIRLLRGRAMLKNRLVRRGLIGAAGLCGSQALLPPALAVVPPSLLHATSATGLAVAKGAALAAVTTGTVAALVRAASSNFRVSKIFVAVACLLGIGLTGTGVEILTGGKKSVPTTVAAAPADSVPPASEPPLAAAPPALQPEPIPMPQPVEPEVAQATPTPKADAMPERRDQLLVFRVETRKTSCDCPPSTTLIVVSGRSGLNWRERDGDCDLELPRPTVYRIVVVTDRKHEDVVADLVKFIVRCRV
ncbi:MAG: RNA polymerase sigma factor [Gemmataceae bacterium]